MKHFEYLSAKEMDSVFFKHPEHISKNDGKELLSYALGATLYMPASRTGISGDMISGRHEGLRSVVICLEDSIADCDLGYAEILLIDELSKVYDSVQNGALNSDQLPFIFIRIRNPEHMLSIAKKLSFRLSMLTGFVMPKFTTSNGADYLEQLETVNCVYGQSLYAMPILESYEIIYKETRVEELLQVKELLDAHYEHILNVRIGATDFSGIFGLRRRPETTIYDVAVIRDCISDIVNVFGRCEKEYVISGPVWEYFSNGKRILKPKLRKTPFEQNYGGAGLAIRKDLLNSYIDGLIQEVLLDQANGITGKTIIHPTHIKPVHALYAVEYEEYLDAKEIIASADSNNGVLRSSFSNKMNEVKPHYNWAKKTLIKSKVFGVYHEHQNFISILREHVHI